MGDVSYIIRAVPPDLDRVLQSHAKAQGKNFDTVLVETLARGLELDAKLLEHTDLDDLIGSWQEDPAFDEAVAEFGRR